MMFRLRLFIGICFLGSTIFSSLQAQDVGSWSSIQLNKKINDKFSVFLKPIVRHNLSKSKYSNWSPDYAVKYKYDKNWSAMVLGRTWIMPNRTNRQFVFVDVKHSFNKGKFGIDNSLRAHLAADIGDYTDAEFIRWHPNVRFKGIKRFEPLLGMQVFHRLNGVGKIQVVRYVTGFKVDISPKWKFFFQYWEQVNYNSGPLPSQHILVGNFSYQL